MRPKLALTLAALGAASGCSDDGETIYNSLFNCFPDVSPDERRLESTFEATLHAVESNSTRCYDARPVTLLTFSRDEGGTFVVGLENVASRDWTEDLGHRFELLLDVTLWGWFSRDHIELHSDGDLIFAYDESSSGLEQSEKLSLLTVRKDGPFFRVERSRCADDYQFAMTVRSDRDNQIVNPRQSKHVATSRGKYSFTNHANTRLGDVGCTDLQDKVARYSVLKQ